MCQGTFFFIILSYENPTKRKGVIHYEKSCHHRRSGRTHGARSRRRNPETLSRTATGENPVLVACRDADLIIGPIGIVIADSLLGEITPAMAAAIGQSRAQKILIPVSGSSYCRHILVGTQNLPMNEYIHLAAEEAAAYLNHI